MPHTGGGRAITVLAVTIVTLLSGSQPVSAAIAGDPEIVASGLQFPWEVALAPDGRILLADVLEPWPVRYTRCTLGGCRLP